MPVIEIADFENVQLQPPRLDPGVYVAVVEEAPQLKSHDNGKQFLELRLHIKEGPPQGTADPNTGSTSPAGRIHIDRLWLVDGASFRIKALLVSAGILDRSDKESEMAKGKIDSDALQGATVNIKVDPQTYKDDAGNDREGRQTTYIT